MRDVVMLFSLCIVYSDTMISIIKMISAFFLLSLFTISGSQARMLPAEENGIFTTMSNSINHNKQKKWISMVADQITSSSFMISNYRRHQPPSPPPPSSATPLQPWINEHRKKSKSAQLFPLISSIIKRPARPPPPAPGSSTPPKTMIREYGKIPKSPPPPPYTPPTKGHISWKPGMNDCEVTAKSPPPPPYNAPTIVPSSK